MSNEKNYTTGQKFGIYSSISVEILICCNFYSNEANSKIFGTVLDNGLNIRKSQQICSQINFTIINPLIPT